ncbi:MAG: hypothetical protein U9R15_08620, partial [Chloroflexota bacterium]|nr:hypothetical protein [Chloroflexota bacterium]
KKNMATQASAKKVYRFKVCEEYLGLKDDTGAKGCDKAFDNLITNMTAGYRALAPEERVSAPYWI